MNTGPENALSPTENMLDEFPSTSDVTETRGEREGLPRGYRMRADRHYVEQLASRAGGQPVRMLPVDDIDSTGAFPQVDMEPLIQSVRTHGVLHPLLVRRSAARYAVITGRKRLAAAQCLRLPTVPCLVHEVDEAQATALAQADNLMISAASQADDRSDLITFVRRLVAQHLATAQTATQLVPQGAPGSLGAPGSAGSLGSSLMSRPVSDLVKAHMWRASRLLDILGLITNAPLRTRQDRLLPTTIEQVVEGFSAESRLQRFTLRAELLDGMPSISIDQWEALAGVSGAVIAMLPLVEQMEEPTIVIRVAATSSSTTSSTTIDVVETTLAVPPSLARRFFDRGAYDRPGGWSALAGALAAKTLAERHGGRATFETGSNRGGGVRINFPRQL